jgi:aminocarboxymuconate-semialdehyde decarboxylase
MSRRVDVHAHLIPEAALKRVPEGMRAVTDPSRDEVSLEIEGGRGQGRAAPRNLRDLAAHRSVQAGRGVDLSLIGPWIDMVKAPLDPHIQVQWCQVINDELAAAVTGSGHSRFLAALPDLDGGAAGEELERAVEAGAVGGMLAANPDDGSLARKDMDALWRAAERLRAPLVLHPGEFIVPPRLREFFMVNLVGNPFETTLAVGVLLGADVPARFPDLDVVLVHGGGFYPYQYARMTAGFERWPTLRGTTRSSPTECLRWFWYDTVLFDGPPTSYLLDLVGDDRVMAGSDCPFAMADPRPFQAPGSIGLDGEALDRVLGGNASALFRLEEGEEAGR